MMAARHPDDNSPEDERINWSQPYIVENLTDVLSVTGFLISEGLMKHTDMDYVQKGDQEGTKEAMNRRFIHRLQTRPVRTQVDKYTVLLKALRKSGDDHVAEYMEKTTAERLALRTAAGEATPVTCVQVAQERLNVTRRVEALQLASSPLAAGDDVSDGRSHSKGRVEVADSPRPAREDSMALQESLPARSAFPQPNESGMHRYSRNGDLKMLKHLIERCNKEVNVRDWKGRTPLFYAVEQGNREVVLFLTRHKADVKVADKTRRWTALHFACERGSHRIAVVLLNQGADVNAVDLKGQTPLYVACTSNSKDTVNLLLRWKARVDLARIDETTPLMAAAGTGNERIVEALLSTNALEPGSPGAGGKPQQGSRSPRVPARNLRGETALHFACRFGHYKAAELLIKHNAPVHCQNEAGLTPLYCASQSGWADVVRLLLENGAAATVDLATKEGATPLYIASEKAHTEIVKLLISANAQINFKKARTQHTPLITAANSGHTPVVHALLEHQADVNVQNEAGWTPLHAACYNGHTDVAVLLIEREAKVDVKDKDGATPLHLACYHGQSEITLTERLLQRSAQAHAVDTSGRTPLHDSCLHPHRGITELLIDNGASVDAQDARGKTPLHYASENGHAELIDLLVTEKGAHVNSMDRSGDTPLHLACQHGHREVVMALVDTGAYVDIQNVQGEIPLHCAIKNDHFETYEWLVVSVQDMHIQNKQGQSPLFLATEKGWI